MEKKRFEKMCQNIEKILISEEEIVAKVKELGKRITEDYADATEEIIVIGLLRGSFIFMSDLVKEIKLPIKVDFMTVSSYGDEMESSREVRILKDLDEHIVDKNVILVEDIIDSGITLSHIVEILAGRSPKSIKLCTFLNKPERREKDVYVDYIGYNIPNEFVVGYGLDYKQELRNLPYIAVVKGEE